MKGIYTFSMEKRSRRFQFIKLESHRYIYYIFYEVFKVTIYVVCVCSKEDRRACSLTPGNYCLHTNFAREQYLYVSSHTSVLQLYTPFKEFIPCTTRFIRDRIFQGFPIWRKPVEWNEYSFSYPSNKTMAY